MANEYARLLINLEANTRQFTGEMQKATGSINSFQSGMKKMAGAFAGIFAVRSVLNYAKGVSDAADAQNKLARRLGVTKSEVDALELSFTKGGQSIQQAEKTLDIFNRRIGELRAGETTMVETFQRLGISVESFLGQSYVDRLITIKKTLEGMTTDARAFASQELFGRGGAKIYEGLKGLEESSALVKEINRELGITDDSVGSIEDMNDAFTENKKRLELVATAILTKLAPAIEEGVLAFGRLGIAGAKTGGILGSYFESIGQAYEMGGIGSAVNVGVGGVDIETQNQRYENYIRQLEQGSLSPSGGTLPTNLDRINARSDMEGNAAAEEEAQQRVESLTNSFLELFGTLDTNGAAALQKYQEGLRVVENAMAEGIITEEKKWEVLGILADQYHKVVPNAIDETVAALQREQEALNQTMTAYQNLAMGMDYAPEQISFMENSQVLYDAWQAGIIGIDEYTMRVNILMNEMNGLLGLTQEMPSAWGNMQNFALTPPVPSSGMQIMDISNQRFQAPGVAATMTASQAASMAGGGLEDISRQQLTTQQNIEMGINQMNFLLARGLI